MAAASSSSCNHPKHDVFLSFRGEDTRNTFTSYLYQALRRKGIGVYMDENQLEKGQKLSPALLKAIEESKISVIIFSENYASSSWCLEELFKIMGLERADRQVALPIFYHVNPSDVRKITGNFEKAFAEHLEKWADRVDGWKAAFTDAGYLKGWNIVGDRPEPEYIEGIVQDIIKKLNGMSHSDSKGLVGIHHHREQIKQLLGIKKKDIPIREIGIWGMGGIGKTTYARAVYDEVCGEFESCCFLANVAEESEKRDGITSLRNKLLSTILEEGSLHSGTARIGSLKERLHRKKVLVVLDDVSDLDQLEILAVSRDLGYGSRTIITSRDKQVLKIGSVDEIYEVKGLNYFDSLHLFSLYAFKKDHPLGDFKDLSDRVLEYAKGVPIALKVLGSALYQKSKVQWESALIKLKEHSNPKIHNLLKISFDGLDDIERNIFLDIACFFKGKKTADVAKLLASCYEGVHFGLSNLVDKCLLSITVEDNTLWMHDLLQEMGWNIVRHESKEPGERSRLWTPKDVCRVLKSNLGTKSIEGIFLDMYGIDEIQLHPDVFGKMHNLRFINFYYSLFSGKEGRSLLSHQDLTSLPGELSYFHWEYCPLKSLPSNFTPEKLVELRLPNSNFERLWDKDQDLANLRVIDLRNCKNLTEIPDLSRALNIQELEVSGCISLVELPRIIHLKALENLCLHNCPVTVFPEIPRNLKTLNLNGTQIEEVPSSIECLKELCSLHMSHTRIHNLPKVVVRMDSLRPICLSHCPNIICFPNVSKNIKGLILGSTQIEEVPSSIKYLSKLCYLDMSGTRVKNLPSTIVNMSSLRRIHLCHCPHITQFPNVPKNIEILILDNTPIEEVPSSIGRLISLSELSMCDCARIKSLPSSICGLRSLRQLHLSGCLNLESFPEIIKTMQCLIQLTFLHRVQVRLSPILDDHIIRVCTSRNLNVLSIICSDSFANFHYLTTLDLYESNIEKIPTSIRQLSSLVSLCVKCCKNLRVLPELPLCLQNLNAHDCTSLGAVSNTRFCVNPRLVHMLFSNCFNLDPNVVDDLVANALLRLQCMAKEWLKESLSGFYEIITDNIFDRVVACGEISERFVHQSMNSSITIKLCPGGQSGRCLCFVPCVVVDFQNNHENIGLRIVCNIQLKMRCGDYHNSQSRWTSPMYSDEPIKFEFSNMVIWFDYNMLKDKHYEEASFEFYITAKDDGRRVDHTKVEKCGVHVFYVDTASSIEGHVESNHNFSSDEAKGKLAVELLESSYSISSYLPCIEDEENECDPDMVQFQPKAPVRPNWLSLEGGVNNPTITKRGTKRGRSSGSFSCDYQDESK